MNEKLPGTGVQGLWCAAGKSRGGRLRGERGLDRKRKRELGRSHTVSVCEGGGASH